MKRILLPVLAVLLLPAFASAAPRNVVLFVTDDQGQDAGCYGNKVIHTPHLDALAADGTRFPYDYCTTSSCSASRSVILSGLHNHANGQYGHQHSYHHFSAFDTVQSLPVLLSAAGYRTARIGKFHVAPDSVFRFDVQLPGNPRSSVEMAERCKEFLSAAGDKPFFLYFCTADPHRGGGKATELPHHPARLGNTPKDQAYPGVKEVKYDPKEVIVPPFLPATPACRAELAQYYQAVSRADQGLGKLVQILKDAGKYNDTLIIYISDNGIPFPGAKTTTYEPGLRLPCVVRNPYVKKRGLVSEAMVSWVDLAPTILDFANAPALKTAKLHGRSFLPVLEPEKPAGWDEVFASHTFHEVHAKQPHFGPPLRWGMGHSISNPIPSPERRRAMFKPLEVYQLGPVDPTKSRKEQPPLI